MIRTAFSLVPADQRRRLPGFAASAVVAALGQAAGFIALVPLLEAIFAGEFGRAAAWLAAMAAAVAVAAVAGYLQSATGLRIGVGMLRGVSMSVGDRLAALPLGWFDGRDPAAVARVVVADVRDTLGVFAHLFGVLVTSTLVPAFIAIGLAAIDWRLSVAMLIALAVLAAVNYLAAGCYRRADAGHHAAATEADSRILEFASAQQTLRAFNAAGEKNAALAAALSGERRRYARLVSASIPGLIGFTFVIELAFLVLVYGITVWVAGGEVSAAAAIALIVVTARFTDPLNQLAQNAAASRTASAAARRVAGLLAEEELPDGAEGAAPEDISISFDAVDFGYAPGVRVVRGQTFTVPAGSTTAIIGPSGSGKTTLLRLAARAYDVDSGAVRIGGCDVREMPLETLMAQISPVFQDVYLFNQTIEENIRIGRPGATDEQVRAAARAAAVDEIVERLPDGWRTVVGERGANLSGGERQRVSIARALLKDAPIVLLDEATSALDPHNEAMIVRGLRELTQGKTVVVVAHRLSTVREADQILVVDDGAIVDRGTHAELAARPGLYADFCHQRENARGWRLAGAGLS